MKKLLWVCAAVYVLCAGQIVSAADQVAPNASGRGTAEVPNGSEHHPWTLEEARKHAHDYADNLDKMTPGEWDAMLEKRRQSMEKWKSQMAAKGRTSAKSQRGGMALGNKPE